MHKLALLALVRVVLPAGLLLSIALRPFGLSLVYLFLFLLAPLVQVPDSRSFRGGRFILLTVVLSLLLLLVHAAWHSVLLRFNPNGVLLSDYPLLESIGLNLGLVSYHDIDPYMAVHYISPELVMTGISLSVYLITKKVSAIVPDKDHKKDRKYQRYPMLVSAGKYICLFLIMFSGIMRPSVTSGIYFLVFMGAATAWAAGQPLGKGFAVVSRCLMAIMAAHIAGLLVYQCTWLIELYPPERDMARYFGLTKLVMINETSPNSFMYEVIEDKKWATLASPLVILFTYFVLAVESRELFKPKVAYSYINSKALRENTSENVPLMRGMSTTKRWSSVRSTTGIKPLHQDSTGSVVVPDDDESLMEEEEVPTLTADIVAAIFEFFQVLVRSSYIATTITMMAWSIMFHSWLTFVLLMWANIVWLRHDQRSFMLKTSPVLVCYAMFLLLAQYVYGMDLTEAELPSNITEVNLSQIGLSRPNVEPCVPLLIKSLFTCMFWVTLRQRIQEIRQRRRSAVITDMAAPLQLTVSTAASGIEAQREEENRSRLLKKLGDILKYLCARYWIYVVVIMLFVIGITGNRMTIFKIIYMFLFLTFILVFQTSWYWWRRLMYVFWITLIIYSMLNLILIYIYQFDNFSKTIEQYLLINEKLQHDLGLEPYHPADLFVKLLTPTLFLIITIMQVHYFHKDFMALSDPKTSFSRSNSMPRGQDSSRPSQAGASTMRDDLPPLSMEGEQPSSPTQREGSTPRDQNFTVMHYERTSGSMKRRQSHSYAPTISDCCRKSRFGALCMKNLVKLRTRLRDWMEHMFMYLDIHLVKVIFVALMLLCVVDVCAMHVPIMVMIAPALWLSSRKQRFCVLFISTLINVYFMAIMVYQIDYIQHSMFDVNCTTSGLNDTANTTVYNNAEWLGFIKFSKQKPLVDILKGYIGLIALFTFYSLVTYRQQALRSLGVLPQDKYKTMFADITRKDADKDVLHCLKFLINYGFYKFGIEVCLICLIGVIGSRMDVYAVFYAGWLLILVLMTRSQLAKIWPIFTAFVTILIPLQYMIAVGFLPQLCVNYPWDRRTEQWRHIRRWLFLPFADDPPYAMKLIFDYFLLLFATRQIRVFYVEKSRGDNYPGGSNNENIGQDWEMPTFVNPVPDFLGYVGTWLDVVKRLVFLGMLWVTLAIMFMTGTNRVNLFSMGYLIGSFVFLWQGTDFYLRPKETILQWWSWLIRYNVSVVTVKTLLQVPGCMFSALMQEHACWLVQLLGIGCVDKFEGNTFKGFLKMQRVKEDVCSVPQEDIGLAWDGVCFAFLILQRRLFHSYYFYRVIDESKATTVLASRGAELIEQLRQKQMNMQEEAESKILDKIKIKMERIKANQKKIQGALDRHERHHDAARDRPQYRAPTSHQKAVRSGDYYMFDEFDDTDGQDVLKREESDEDEDAPDKKMGLGKGKRTPPSTQPSAAERLMGVTDIPMLRGAPDDEPSDKDEYADKPEQETALDKAKRILDTVAAFIASFIVSVTRHVMKYSRDYRYVSRTLSVEKKILKEREGFGIGLREGSNKIWEPLPEILAHNKDVTTLEEQDDSIFKKQQLPFIQLGYALWYAILAHTDIVCYIMVFINQIQSATILSIPLPLMVFLWGTLTIPRPTKTFWVTLIAYTEVIVLIKSMFQFEILPWNQKATPDNTPFTAPRIIGIERKVNYALYDLLLLLIIFLHRFMLKSLGLWKESTPDIELREDVEYPLTQEDTELVVEGRGDEVGQKYIELHDIQGPRAEGEDLGLSLDNEKSVVVRKTDDLADDGEQDNEAGPSKLSGEDGHFLVNDEQEPIIAVTTVLEDKYKHFPEVMLLSLKRYLRPTQLFFKRMLAPGARVTADVYAYMFLCDFINFLVVIFGFAAFGTHQGDGGVQAYLEENKVPIPFLIMLILQFALIVIDRALYLRKFILGKILFQYGLIVGVHIWMFFVLPFITERTFNTRSPPPIWYMMKCIYLLLSAYQIRCGYPRRIIGNFLCKSYHFVNMIFFRGFMAVPFVFELRTLMDWIWTDTSMTLMDWLKMEDIFASVFLLKCSRYVEDEFPQPRGAKKSPTAKYLLGGAVLALVIAIIWFPLVFFAFGNSVGESNPPTDVTVKIRIGPFLPVYQMSAQKLNIDIMTEQDYLQLSNNYVRDRTAQTFLSNYMYDDVAVISLNTYSTAKWMISPPELKRLEDEVVSNASLSVKFSYIITHPTNAVPNPPTLDDNREVALMPFLPNGTRNPERDKLLMLLNGTATSDTWLHVHTLFPKFLKVFNKGITKPADQLNPDATTPDSRLYRDVQLRLDRDDTGAMYWRVRELCTPAEVLMSIPMNDCEKLILYTFNDKLFPETLNFISGSGIIGLYTTFVFLASRVLRGFFSGIYTKIMFDDLPNVDRVLQLCLDIYLVREALELSLEEDLFAKLVFLYRSPETMIKWSRPKEDQLEPQRALPPSR